MNKDIVVGILSLILVDTLLLTAIINMGRQQQVLAQEQSQQIVFVPYKDPEGRFTMAYPSDWTLFKFTPENKSRSGGVDVAWNSANSTTTPKHNILELSVIEGVPPGATLQQAINRSAETQKYLYFNIYEIGKPDFTKYKIDGHDTASILIKNRSTPDLTRTRGIEFDSAHLSLISLIDGKAIGLRFSTNQKDYDKMLPIIDKMVNSVKILKL